MRRCRVFHPIAEWLQVDFKPPSLSGGVLPKIGRHGQGCEGDGAGGWDFEICLNIVLPDVGPVKLPDIWFDYDFDFGRFPTLNPGHLSLASSKGPIKKIEFGITDPTALGSLAQNFSSGFSGTVFNTVNSAIRDPLAFAVNQLA